MQRSEVDASVNPHFINCTPTLYTEVGQLSLNPELTELVSLAVQLALMSPCGCLLSAKIRERLPRQSADMRAAGDPKSGP